MSHGQIFSFGPYQLDIRKEQLWCATQPVRLTPKAFQLLSYVVVRPGQLVSKEELFQVVWAETVVSDAALTTCVQEIRKALQDDARKPVYLETVHRRGFRFIGEVVSSQHSVASSQESEIQHELSAVSSQQEEVRDGPLAVRSEQLGVRSQREEEQLINGNGSLLVSLGETQRNPGEQPEIEPQIPLHSIQAPELDNAKVSLRVWPRKGVLLLVGLFLLVGALVVVRYVPFLIHNPRSPITNPEALPLPDKPSLIVLPLVNLSNDPEQEYFSDGLTEVLTGDLSKISSLLVIARNSAFTYKGKAVKVQDVSKEMGVRYVLEGSVQKAEQRVRIAVQLIDATTGYEVWTEQYDRPLTDIFTLQDEIVQKIVTTLKLQLTLEEQGWIVRKQTTNLEAYDAFLRGQAYYMRFTLEGNTQARQLFEKAITLDPQYADAYAGLGITYLVEWAHRWGPFQVLEQALRLGQQALALDDAVPLAHSLLGMVYAEYQQYEQAIAEGEQSITLAPNNAHMYINLAVVLNLAGRHEDARRTAQQAIRLNPYAPPNFLFQLGWSNFLTGRYTEAITTLQDLGNRNPTFPFVHTFLAASYLMQWLAQLSPAGQTLEPAMAEIQQALALNDSVFLNHILLGAIFLCQRQYDQALAEMERAVALDPNVADSPATLAVVLTYVGRTEEALQTIDQALRLKPTQPDVHLGDVGGAYALAGRYEQARMPLQRYLSHYPNNLLAHLMLVGVYSELGQDTEAQKEVTEVLRLNPKFSLEVHKRRIPIKDPAVLDRHIAALRKAGLK